MAASTAYSVANRGTKKPPGLIWSGGFPEPMVRFELTACRLRGGCSATELHRHNITPPMDDAQQEYQIRQPDIRMSTAERAARGEPLASTYIVPGDRSANPDVYRPYTP